VTELLPWLVNDTLRGVERAGVERHLAECAACRGEMEDLRTLQASIAEDDVNPEVTHALGRLNGRLDGARPGLNARQILRWISTQWSGSRPVLRGAVIAQFAVLSVLIGALLTQSAPQYYRTLGTSPGRVSAGDQVVVVFNPSLRETELRGILLDLHARIVDGPSPAGAYTLELAPGEQRAALAKLRRHQSVVFAEPVP
jgi:anti-sigma factor RsiW